MKKLTCNDYFSRINLPCGAYKYTISAYGVSIVPRQNNTIVFERRDRDVRMKVVESRAGMIYWQSFYESPDIVEAAMCSGGPIVSS